MPTPSPRAPSLPNERAPEPATGRSGVGLVTAAAFAALLVLVSLGTWQLQRKAWKEELIRDIADRARGTPITLAEARRRLDAGERVEFTRVGVSGRFLHEEEIHVYAPFRPVPGYHVFTPLVTTEGGLVFVNRGAVPEAAKDPAQRTAGQIAGEVSLVGRLRLPEAAAWFTPANDERRNIWHRRDPSARAEAIARRRGAAGETRFVLPFYLDAEAEPANPGGWPKGGTTPTKLANRHLEYAITWYGLALTLIGVYAAFVGSRRRR